MKLIFVLLAVVGLTIGLGSGLTAEEYERDANTLALYHFMYGEEWADSAAINSTQTLYEATYPNNNHLWPVLTGAYGGGYYFDGARAATGYTSSLRLDGVDKMASLLGFSTTSWLNGVTYEMMVNPSSNYNTHGPAGSSWVVIAELSGTATLYAYQTASGLLPCVAMQCLSEANGAYSEVWFMASSSFVLKLNEWGHVAWTFDQANHIAKIWVNGKVAATLNTTGLKIRNKATWPLTIGNRWSDDALFSGTVDEVRISNIARSFSVAQQTSSLTGQVNLADYNGNITAIPVTIELGNNINPITLNLGADGKFTILDVPNGTYDVSIKASHWLAKTTNIEIIGNTDMGVVTLTNGDINGDNGIDETDLAILSNNWYLSSEEAADANSDLNGDGGIDESDLAILSSTWYLGGD